MVAPARTPASELATPTPASSWQWMPTSHPTSATTAAVAASIASGSVAPLVSHSVT